MVVTEEVFHADTSLLKAVALAKVASMLTTELVFQLCTGLLKDVAEANINDMELT